LRCQAILRLMMTQIQVTGSTRHFTLPPNANNQSDFTLRFHALLSSANDKVWLDDIKLTGSDIVEEPETPTCTESQHLVENVCVDNEPVVPTCTEGQHLVDAICVENTPTPPTCTETQHLEENVCVENPASTGNNNGGGSTDDSTPQSNNNGGGTVLGLLGQVYVNPSNGSGGGTVLGTSTSATGDDGLPAGCNAYLGDYLKFGGKNNPEQVKKLQTFLNKHSGAGLPVTGIFGPMTFNEVMKFQLVQWEKVLKPWVAFGLPTDHTPTGYVYKTTRHTINLIECSDLSEPAPQLP
jgi:hypothetical protein